MQAFDQLRGGAYHAHIAASRAFQPREMRHQLYHRLLRRSQVGSRRKRQVIRLAGDRWIVRG
jgi:hypothetical protein